MFDVRTICVVLPVAIAMSALPTAVFAASCLDGVSRVADKDISSFMSDPGSALTANPVGGLGLANQIRGLVASSSDTLKAVVEMAKTANGDQASSIGSGLARAVAACSKIDTAYADQIQQEVAGLGNPQLIAGFTSTSDEIRTAAIGAAAAGPGGGAIGGPGNLSADNLFKYPGDATARLSPFDFTAAGRASPFDFSTAVTQQVLVSPN